MILKKLLFNNEIQIDIYDVIVYNKKFIKMFENRINSLKRQNKKLKALEKENKLNLQDKGNKIQNFFAFSENYKIEN